MRLQLFSDKTKRILETTVLGVVFLATLLCAISVQPKQTSAQADSGSGTVPPPASFIYEVSPASVRQADTVAFKVTVVNTHTIVDAVVGLTSTVPPGVAVVTDTLTANSGEARIASNGSITWTGAITQPGFIIISYQAEVRPNTCGDRKSKVTLYAIENRTPFGDGPTELSRETTFTIDDECTLYLPRVSRALTPIPVLQNWNFEAGANAPGWGEFDNDQPATLIYSSDRKALPKHDDGKWFGWLGGVLNKRSELRQSIKLPRDHRGIELRFLYIVESSDTCGADKDNGYVLLDGIQVGNTFELCNNSGSWQQAKLQIPSSFWDKPVILTLRSVTNSAKNSNWFVDNVVFCSTDPRAAAADRCN